MRKHDLQAEIWRRCFKSIDKCSMNSFIKQLLSIPQKCECVESAKTIAKQQQQQKTRSNATFQVD